MDHVSVRLRTPEGARHREGIPAIQGEVHSEYLRQMEKEAQIRAMEEKRNEEASLALALQLLAEDSITEDGLTTTDALDPRIMDHKNSPLSPSKTVASSSQVF